MKIILKRKLNPWSKVELYDHCKHMIGTYWTRSGRKYTGLDLEDTERLGKLLGKDLASNSDFWKTFNVVITSNTDYVLHDVASDPWEELIYKFLKNHKNVSNGYRDRKPNTEYVLISEEDSAKVINKEAKVKVNAIKAFSNMTPDEMRKALRLFGYSASDSSNEIVESTLYQLIEDNPAKFLELWVENKNKEYQFLIEEAVANNILRKNKTTYKYGTDVVGNTLEDAIDYLKNPANSDLYLSIKDQISGKKRIYEREEVQENESEIAKIQKEIKEEEAESKAKSSKKSKEL